MSLTYKHWIAALLLSSSAHFAVSYFLHSPAEPVLEAGSAGGGEIVLMGESDFDAISAGNSAAEQQAEDTAEIQPAETLETVEPETNTEITPETPETTTPAESRPEAPVETRAISQMTPTEEAIEPQTPQETVEPNEIAALSPAANETEEIEPLINAPVPKPRPDPPPQPVAKKAPAQKPAPQKAASAGNGGKSSTSARRQETKGTSTTKRTAAGNADMTNYQGQVRRKIQRRLRYSKSDVRRNGGGQTTVAFTITSGGQATGIRVIASSGSQSLDKAAMGAVQSASPFPALPDNYGSSRMALSIPILFQR